MQTKLNNVNNWIRADHAVKISCIGTKVDLRENPESIKQLVHELMSIFADNSDVTVVKLRSKNAERQDIMVSPKKAASTGGGGSGGGTIYSMLFIVFV